MHLAFVSQRGDGAKAVSLARFGNYEVLLVELAQDSVTDHTQVWVELYDHKVQNGLDSCGCADIEDATIAARELISRARQLNEKFRLESRETGRTAFNRLGQLAARQQMASRVLGPSKM
jgi:hypothetical protein